MEVRAAKDGVLRQKSSGIVKKFRYDGVDAIDRQAAEASRKDWASPPLFPKQTELAMEV